MAGQGGGGGVKATGETEAAAKHTTEVLNQRRRLPLSPMRLAIGGFGFALTIGYLVLYSKKKPEASALDVAKVASGVSHPDNTHPRD